MTASAILRAFARNNAWANHRLHGACAHLSHAELHAPRTSFFPTIMKTLNHILTVDWYYVDALAHGDLGLRAFEPEEPFGDFAELRAAQRVADLKLIGLAEHDLEREVRLQRADHVQVERACDVLMHLFQHQIHHRGQVHAMVSGTHVAPPQLDEFFLREELPLRRVELEDLGLTPE